MSATLDKSESSKPEELRRHPRLPMRMAVQARPVHRGVFQQCWSANVSAGGMYLLLKSEDVPEEGSCLRLRLAVPPGEGYWAGEVVIDAHGKVARVDNLDHARRGVAVEFTEPPSLRLMT